MRKYFIAALAALALLCSITARAQLIVNELYGFGVVPPSAAVPLAIATTNTYVQDTTSTTHAVNLPSGITAGDLLIVIFQINAITGGGLDDPAGWTVAYTDTSSDWTRVYAKIASGSEGSTLTINVGAGGSGERAAATSYRITGNRNGVSSSEITVGSATNFGSVSNPDAASVTAGGGSAENLFITLYATAQGSVTVSSWPANYTLGQLSASTSTLAAGVGVVSAARLVTAASDDAGAWTLGAAKSGDALTFVIRPQ